MRTRSVTQVRYLPRGSSSTFTERSSLPEPLELITAAGQTAVPAPLAPTKKQAKSKAEGCHKRQISEAIPGAEREAVRVPREGAKAVNDGLRARASQNHVISNAWY